MRRNGVSMLRGLITPSLVRAASTSTRSLVLKNFGVPEKVLEMVETPASEPSALREDEVLINILAAPINPSDINTIEGKYPLRPELPASPGHEGVGIVSAVGQNVTRFRPGDRVVPIEHSQGTWRTHGVFKERHWYRIPADLPISVAATMVINPPTALRLLEEYVPLKTGDTIIQTGANSAAGKYVIQLAREKGVHTINIIRDRPNRAEIESELKDLGATLVVTLPELQDAMKEWQHGDPILGLDCIGGEAATAMSKAIAVDGTIVVYGGMSKEPVCFPPGNFIFKNISVKGFWLTGGYAKMKDGWKAKEHLVDRVCALFRQKVLKPVSVDCVPLSQWEHALSVYRRNQKDQKILLTNYPDDVCL